MSLVENESFSPQSKKAGFHIAKFHYHLHNTIPELLGESQSQVSPHKPTILRSRRADRNMVFHFASHSAEGVSTLDCESILESARKLYVGAECIRVGASSFKRSKAYKVPYLPIYGDFHEILEFQVVDRAESRPSRSRLREEEGKTALKQGPSSSNNFELYVIHHCHSGAKEGGERMRWQNFIQKYHFVDQVVGEELKHRIHYSLIFNYQAREGLLLGLFAPHHKLYESFLGEYLAEDEQGLQSVSKMQGFLLLAREKVGRKLRELSDPAHQEGHKRWLKLPSEYFKQFATLKKHALSYYGSIHEEARHPEHVLSNLVCRYMHAMDYNYKASLEAVLEYLRWEKEMAANYNLAMFADLHKLDLFSYLGRDFEGRLVILNRASHLMVDELGDVEHYCEYFMYFLEVWLQRKWGGYADQYTVIADVGGLGASNFKLAITKRNVSDGLKYCPERQHKMIAVNVSSFAYFVWNFLQPLLPKRTVSKLSVVGTDKHEILDVLTKEMDISVVPEYLGGKNKRTFMDDLEEDMQHSQVEQSQK